MLKKSQKGWLGAGITFCWALEQALVVLVEMHDTCRVEIGYVMS